MGAKVRRSRSFQANIVLLHHALRYALRYAGAQKQLWSVDGRRVNSRITSGFWSWGENINATIYNDGIVLIESSCVAKTQILDWGKNARNIAKIFKGIEQYLVDDSFINLDGHSIKNSKISKQ